MTYFWWGEIFVKKINYNRSSGKSHVEIFKKMVCMLIAMMLSLSVLCVNADAVTIRKKGANDTYQPLHVAILMDESASLDSSDPERISRDAAKAFLNCVPSNQNEIALFFFFYDLQKKKNLTSIASKENIDDLNNELSSMNVCSGRTNMVSAIVEVDDYLRKNSDENYKNVIVVFTDGAETGLIDEEKLLTTDSNQDEIHDVIAEKLKDTDSVVYSVAFDYKTDKGVHSIGKDGYGKKILDEIAKQTGGQVMITETGDIDSLDDQFLKIVNELCNIRSESIDQFAGDGKLHETTIDITDVVVEADIRISTDTLDKMSSAIIKLYDPENNEVKLSSNSDDVWYNFDRLAANIKIMHPKQGKWKLTVENLKSDKPINVNLIKQYNMSFKVEIKTSTGNPEKASLNEQTQVEVNLVSDGQLVTYEPMYNDPKTEAYVFLTKGKDDYFIGKDYTNKQMFEEFTDVLEKRPNTKKYPMKSTGKSFVADILMESEDEYIVGVWVCSSHYYCYEEYPISVSYNFGSAAGKEFGDIKLNQGETKTIDKLHDFCTDDKADISVSAGNDVVGVQQSGDSLTLTGKNHGDTEVVVTYKSPVNGEKFEKKIKVSVLNAPPVVSKAAAIEMQVGDTLVEKGILNGVKDPEGDKLEISGARSDNQDVVTVKPGNGEITIEAVSAGEAKITVEITDGINKVNKVIEVKVNQSPLFVILLIGGILAAVAIIAAIAIIMGEKSRKFHIVLKDIYFVSYSKKSKIIHKVKSPVSLSSSFVGVGKVEIFKLIESIISDGSNNISEKDDLNRFIEDNRSNISKLDSVKIVGDKKNSTHDMLKGKLSGANLKNDPVEYYDGDNLIIDLAECSDSNSKLEFNVIDESSYTIFTFSFIPEVE